MSPKFSDLLKVLQERFGCRLVEISDQNAFTLRGERIILLNGTSYRYRYLEREHEGEKITCPVGFKVDEILSESTVRMIRDRLRIDEQLWPRPFD